jgi:ABC transporter, phosphonate, periplasmic substrate-binding protein
VKALIVLLLLAGTAHADNVTVGLYAPSAPFPSTSARVELATRLGEHIGKALGGTGTGKVYARAADFTAAVKKGEVTIALVEPAYLASTGNYTVLAASVRGGETEQSWQLVGRGAKKLAELRGKRVLVPANGGKEADFALNVLFGGLEKDFFRIDIAPDTVSAVAALGLGKADAAIVPGGIELPAGTSQVLALGALTTPMLVSYGGVTPQQRAAIIAAVGTFKGDGTVGGFRAADAEAIKTIARRFGAPVKRGPLVVPSVRLVVGDLVEGRKLAIERTPATAFIISR